MGNDNPHKLRSWIGTVVTLLVLVFILIFTWRVLHYASLLRSGELTVDDLAFVQELSISKEALQTPIPDGDFDVATDDDPSLGSEDAEITIVEFADFGCPYSRKSSYIIRALARKYEDKVRFVYRDFPIDELHPEARLAAEAGNCAADQGKFWEYHDKLYQNQTDLSENKLMQFAKELDLDTNKFQSCLQSGRHAQEVEEDYQDGLDAGVRGTPTFFINGNRIPGSIPEDVLDAIIQRLLVN